MSRGILSERRFFSSGKIWLLFFLCPLLVGFFVQFVALPRLFPSLHAGEGLLKGGDWLYFHNLAVKLAEKIRTEGWSAWQLRPEGQAPAGIAAFFYVLFIPKPWVLVPLNALLHGSSTFLLMKIVELFARDRRKALLSVLPFWLFPSAMTWYTQIHKDGIAIFGAFLFLYGWGAFFSQDGGRDKKSALLSAFAIFFGGVLIWVVRPYVAEILWFLSIIMAFIVSIWSLSLRRPILPLLFLWGAILFLFPFTRGGEGGEAISIEWRNALWLPDFFEQKLMGLARTRLAYFSQYDPNLGGNIDWHVSFHSVGDVLRYIPRALEIALFAPFPQHWLTPGTSPAGYITRKIAGVEMLFVYTALLFFLLFLFCRHRDPRIWVLLYFSLSVMLIYALSVPNVGSLYRARYGFLMILVSLGWADVLSLRKKFQE